MYLLAIGVGLPDLVILLALRLVFSFLLHLTLTPHQEVLHTERSPDAAADCPNLAAGSPTTHDCMQLLAITRTSSIIIYL